MDTEVKIKEEPLDVEEDAFIERQPEMQTEMMDFASIKVEDEKMSEFDVFHFDEQADIITVNAADLKSEDERQFIKHIQQKDFLEQTKLYWTCQNCGQTFFSKHTHRQHVNNECCVQSNTSHKRTALDSLPLDTPKKRGKFINICDLKSYVKPSSTSTAVKHGYIPICNLRLKPQPAPLIADDIDNEDNEADDDDNDVTSKLEVVIKSEPVDETEDGSETDDSQSPSRILTTNSNFSDVAIKPEPLDIDYDVAIKSEPIFDMDAYKKLTSKEVSQGKSYLKPQSITNNTATSTLMPHNLSRLRLPSIKTASTQSASVTTKPLQSLLLPNNNIMIRPLNLQGMKIMKLAPNAKIVRLPVKTQPQLIGNAVINATPNVLLKLNSFTPTIQNTQQSATASDIAKLISKRSFKLNAINSFPDKKPSTEPLTTAALRVRLGSLCENTTIDQEDLKKLLSEVVKRTEDTDRKHSLSKYVMEAIDSLPEKRELIDNMLDQIKQATTRQSEQNVENVTADFLPTIVKQEVQENAEADAINVSTQPSEDDETDNSNNVAYENTLGSRYVPALSQCDAEISMLRKNYSNYRFAYMCPRCPRQYGQKHAFRGHLVGIHVMCKDELENLMVEVKPFLRIKSFRAKDKSAASSEETNASTDEETPTSTTTETASTPSVPIKMSVFNKTKKALAPKTQQPASRFVCYKCGRHCSSRSMLSDHVRGNCSREPQYQCQVCSRKYFSASTLTCHMSIHTGELPHKCSYCEKRFRTRGQVTVHHRTHTGEKPFVCEVCSQNFTHRETLIAHLSRHIGMKRYKCYACEKTFSCISGLKTHRDIRPDTCGKVKFNSRAVGPRVRVIKGSVIFEPQPEINPYLRTQDPQDILNEIQNQQPTD